MSDSKEKNAKVTPSGPDGKNPSTAGPGPTGVQSNTPENQSGHINPSAPNDATITPGTDYEQPKHPPKGGRTE